MWKPLQKCVDFFLPIKPGIDRLRADEKDKSLFSLTEHVLEEIEVYILTSTAQTPFGRWALKHAKFPLNLIMLGSAELFRPMVKFSCLSVLMMLGGLKLFQGQNVHPEVTNLLFSLCFFVPAFVATFEAPSIYGMYGVNAKHVDKITTYLYFHLGFDTEDKVKLLEENLDLVIERTKARVDAFKWLIGAAWALQTYLMSQTTTLFAKMPQANPLEILRTNAMSMAELGAISVCAVLLAVGYKKATDILLKSAKFACAELRFHLLRLDEQSAEPEKVPEIDENN